MRSHLKPAPILLVLGALSAACHSHGDDSLANGGSGAGSLFNFTSSNVPVRKGQVTDVVASFNGDPIVADQWQIVGGPGGELVALPGSDRIRFVAGEPGLHLIEAMDTAGRVGTFELNVFPTDGSLRVTEVVDGTDDDDVAARMTTSGDDHFLAERVGDAGAPQRLVRISRAGDREVEVTLPFKIDDVAADESGAVTIVRPGASLTDALVRVDRDLVEQTTFAAPDLGGALWASVIAVTRDGRLAVATDRNGGELVLLESSGAPVGGTLDASALPLPIAFSDVVDMTAGLDGEIYVASETTIARVLPSGDVDTTTWSPGAQVALRAMDADARGVLHVALQDADGGQCGSIRQLNWVGGQIRRFSDFTDPSATRFAARKVLAPEDIAAFSEGSWRMYDDTVTLDPTVPSAAWIVAGDVPLPGQP